MLRHIEYMKSKLKEVENKAEEQRVKYLSGKDKQTTDMVNHPPHYNKAGLETIDAIKAMTNEGFEYYLQGNIAKYLWRYRYKNGVEDLKKAHWYLTELIDVVEDDHKT